MKLNVKLFAVARQLAGAEVVSVDLPAAATVATLRAAMSAQYPALADAMNSIVFAVNSEYADDRSVIPSDAEVACIPPVSGG
jgi:molybdopterin synthase sulfur carrier subunit